MLTGDTLGFWQGVKFGRFIWNILGSGDPRIQVCMAGEGRLERQKLEERKREVNRDRDEVEDAKQENFCKGIVGDSEGSSTASRIS